MNNYQKSIITTGAATQTMDEMLVMMRTLMEKVEKIENTLEELKDQQRPLSSKDYIHSLKNETATELEDWLKAVNIAKKDIRVLLEEKTYLPLLHKLKCNQCLRIFDTNKNTVYCFTEGKWKTMTKQNLEKVQNALFNKIHKEFTAMKKADHIELKHETIKELAYIEQRGIINMITQTTHTKFKKELYDMLKVNNEE